MTTFVGLASAATAPSPPAAPGAGQLGHGCNLAGAFYASAPLPLPGCITQCEATATCQGFTWKHPASSGAGVAPTPNCSGKVGQPCCYFQSKGEIQGRGENAKFDCWEKSGLPPGPAPPPPPPPPAFTGDGRAAFYADPLFDAAHDAELVWHEAEQCWWMTYLQNRYNSPLADPAGSCPFCVYTDIGLASTPDAGKTWIYRGVAEGVDLPVAYRNSSVPATRPPHEASQQYGGATWWRPAVIRHKGLYHGFFVYNPDPGLAMRPGSMKIVHYTSKNMKQWEFAEIARGDPVAYDSDVFRVGPRPGHPDGSWLLFSTMQGRKMSDGVPKPMESDTLYNWTECEDAQELVNVGEGPHVTGSALNDATTETNGFAWLNWEGGFVARSSDKGATWQQQQADGKPGHLFVPGSSGGLTDFGLAHQGPLIPQPGGKMFVLYFSEFLTTPPEPEKSQVNSRRSMLQLREVTPTADGWLLCNRSDTAFLDTLALAPPADVTTATAAAAAVHSVPAVPVWSVAQEEASVIALAELNRWHGGWYRPHKPAPEAAGCAQKTPVPAACVTGVYEDFRLSVGFYRELNSPSAAACVATCKAEPATAGCGGVVFKEKSAPGGINATGVSCGVGSTCCYLLTRSAVGDNPVANCVPGPQTCAGWDSWAAVGIMKNAKPPPGVPADPGYIPGFGKWRDPKVASQFVSAASSSGSGRTTVWALKVRAKDASTGSDLAYDFSVAANGTILSMKNASHGGALVTPLRQWRRVPPFH
jgi:hypothetical protein